MNEKDITVYIHDLDISDKAKGFLIRAGFMKLSDFLALDAEKLANMHGITDDVYRELSLVTAHSDKIISFFVERSDRITEILPEVQDMPIEELGLGTRSCNALKKAGIHTAGLLIQMSQKDIFELRNVGALSRKEITTAIENIIQMKKADSPSMEDKNPDTTEITSVDTRTDQAIHKVEDMPLTEKGFDYLVIDILTQQFGFKPVKMAEWFGLSRQSIYNALEKRSPTRQSKWTGKSMTEQEIDILSRLIANKIFNYSDKETSCYCMNNKQDNFACLFIYENVIKCFFLKDLPDKIQGEIIAKKMHVYTERELAGESSGQIVYMLTKPYYRPDNPERFRLNAQLRGMTVDAYSLFMSGYPCLDQRSVTDEQIVAFMKDNMVDGKVYILSDPRNQWIRSIASRNGYSIKDLISLYGFESRLDGSELTVDEAKERHRGELKRYIVHDNVVYLPTDSRVYRLIHTYAHKAGIDMNSYIRSLGFERTTERPDLVADVLEKDMEVRKCDGTFEEKIFAAYPLIGSAILKQETIDKLNENSRKYIDFILREPQTRLPLRAEMQIALALIYNAKNWKNEENGNFWNYISLQFGYRDASGAVVRLLQTSLESAIKRNGRLFLENENGREFKSTVVVHALSPRKSWMTLFDFLFDFYKNNLNWRMIPGDPLIAVMIRALGQKLLGDNDDDSELIISSRVYSFQEGIRKLVLYRPVYTCGLFEELIGKINSLVNSEQKAARTYEEQLCEEWFKGKIIAIANTRKSERQSQMVQRDVAIDYSRIRVKYVLKNETDVQLVVPDIRLKNEEVKRATLLISYGGALVLQKNLSWYGNELGKTLNGVSVSIPPVPYGSDRICTHVRIVCEEETIFDSDESMDRNVLLFYGANEITQSQMKHGQYTLIVPAKARVETENADVTEIDALKNDGLKAYFLELKDGYVITVNGQLLAFDSENGTEIRILAPKESATLPSIMFQDAEAHLAYRTSSCAIILGNSDYLQRFVLLKNGEKIEFGAMQQSNNGNGVAFTLPFHEEKDFVRLRVINLADEQLMFDKSFVLIDEANCHFNREFYFSEDDFKNAEYSMDIDDVQELIPFTKDDREIRIPFHGGELHAAIPKVEVEETSGAWLQDAQSVWFISAIPQSSLLKVSVPEKVRISFLVGGKDIQYDGQGLVTIGNVLQSLSGTGSYTDLDVVMNVSGPTQKTSYTLARVFFKERFLRSPEFWFEDDKLYWDHGGVFIGNAGRQFSLILTSLGNIDYEFKLDEETNFLDLPEEMPIGNYRYQIDIQVGTLFKKAKETIATGDCIIGDRNLLRFMDRRIVVESITDESKEEAGHILIRTCYVDQIKFCGVENTSEGNCPVYSGVLYTTGYHGERYEFSFDVHTNKKGVTKMMVNPVRIVYINDSFLCITDPDGDGLYYYDYYDRNTNSIIYALTDHEYTKANKHKYSNADLYSYRTERM